MSFTGNHIGMIVTCYIIHKFLRIVLLMTILDMMVVVDHTVFIFIRLTSFSFKINLMHLLVFLLLLSNWRIQLKLFAKIFTNTTFFQRRKLVFEIDSRVMMTMHILLSRFRVLSMMRLSKSAILYSRTYNSGLVNWYLRGC